MGCLEKNSIHPNNIKNVYTVFSFNQIFNVGFFEEL